MCHLRAWLGIVWCSAYTCKLNDIDPLTWLTDVLERIVSGRTKNHMWTAPSSQGVLQCFDQIACAHMSGLLVRSHMNAGQDGFRDRVPNSMAT